MAWKLFAILGYKYKIVFNILNGNWLGAKKTFPYNCIV